LKSHGALATNLPVRSFAWVVAVAGILLPALARGVQVDALDLSHDWTLDRLRITGARAVPKNDVRAAMETHQHPWYTPWRKRPAFDPVTFGADLDRLRRLYQSRGYYHARIDPDLIVPTEGNALVAVIQIDEGPPIRVERVEVAFRGDGPPATGWQLPVAQGDVFTEAAYERAEAALRTDYRERGYARVKVERRARVDVIENTAEVTFDVDSGPPCTFGDVEIAGLHKVETNVAARELAFRPGEKFRESLLEQSRANLLGLNLFHNVRLEEDRSDASVVRVTVRLTEAPPREIQLGIGYDTEEEVRGLASWRHYNFLGDARQLGATARISILRRTLAGDFLQPHFPTFASRFRLLLSEQQEDEDAYTLDRSRVSPRLEWQPSPRLTAYTFYRFEYDSLADVESQVSKALPGGTPHNAFLSGLAFGLDWNHTDDLLEPTRGWATNTTVEPVGTFLGGDVSFLRLVSEGRFYLPLGPGLFAAFRLRLGTAEPLGSSTEIPIYERFYAGGLNSVRGYGRHRVFTDGTGLRATVVDDKPIGGRSLIETSIELRHPITESLAAAVFLDAGQISRSSYTVPLGSMLYGTGLGLRFRSPIGPLRVDLGFPVQPPDGDAHWQIHLSVGQNF
jgi:outer membrane protein insertion porin family/translocation and assembly module TamA